MSDMPETSRFASIGFGSSACRREKASSRWVRVAARRAPCMAFSAALRTRSGRAASRADLAQDEVEPAHHHGQQVVEIMRDAAGELADGLHLLRVAQRLLGARALLDLAQQLPVRFGELRVRSATRRSSVSFRRCRPSSACLRVSMSEDVPAQLKRRPGLAVLGGAQDRHAAGQHVAVAAVAEAHAMLDLEQAALDRGGPPSRAHAVAVLGVDEVEPVPAAIFLEARAGQLLETGLRTDEAADAVGVPHHRGRRRHEHAEPVLAVAQRPVARFQLVLDALALLALARLGERPQHRHRQLAQPLLDDVVGRALLQRFDRVVLAEHAGDEDEGRGGRSLARDGERLHAVEGGQGVIGEDQLVMPARDGGDEVRARAHAIDPEVELGGAEIFADELRVDAAVLEMEDARDAGGRAAFAGQDHVVRGDHPPADSSRGGGSFSTAQNTPRSWIARKNSWNPTGFTTKALTPSW